MSFTQEQLLFFLETIILEVKDVLVAIDCSFEVVIVNQAAQSSAGRIFGKQIFKGINLRKEFSAHPMLELWHSVLQNGQTRKQELINESHNEAYSISYIPIKNSEKTVLGAFAIIQTTKLSATTDRFATLVDASQSLVWCTDESGNFVQHQKRWESWTGQQWKQSCGKGWMEAFHRVDRPQLLQQFHINRSSKLDFHLALRLWFDPEKTYKTVSLKAAPCVDSNGEIIEWIGTCSDTDQLRELQQQVDERKHEFERLADCMPQLVWTTPADGYLDYCNHKFYEYTGLKKEEDQGWGWNNIVHPGDADETLLKWKNSVATGEKYETKYRLKRLDGSFRWHVAKAEPLRNIEGKIIKWFGTCTDIEDFMEVESKLSSVTEQLDIALKAAHIGVWSWDLTTKVLSCDECVLDMFGIHTEEFGHLAEDLLDRIHIEDRPKVDHDISIALKEREIFDTEFRVATTGKIVASRGEVFRNAAGESIRMTGINWEITSKKLLEQEKLKALQFAEEQGRKRAQEAESHRRRLEEFIDVMCHEIRNPLNGITGLCTLIGNCIEPLLLEDKELCNDNKNLNQSLVLQKIVDIVNTMERCAEQQKVILDDVLDLSKAENDRLELSPTLFNPRSLLESLQNVFYGLMKHKKLEYQIDVTPDADRLFKADSRRISQILINLQSNSIKFTESGFVRTCVSKKMRDGRSYLHFSVNDSGIGMSNEEVGKLFNKFYQPNPTIGSQYGGSGLGLTISKKLVELMGGTFEVKSERGVGSQFHFTVLSPEAEEENEISPQSVQQTTWDISSTRILIVEDNIINQKILNTFLQQQHCHCKLAGNGLEALNFCDNFKFDIIFMDLEMPVMGGLEATQKIRQGPSLNNSTPVVGLSGNARKEHKEEAIRSGMNDYLTKPYNKNDIYRAVSKYCESREENAHKKRKYET